MQKAAAAQTMETVPAQATPEVDSARTAERRSPVSGGYTGNQAALRRRARPQTTCSSAYILRRQCDGCDEEDKAHNAQPEGAETQDAASKDDPKQDGEVQRRASGPGNVGPGFAPPLVHDTLRTPGEPLDAQTLDFMEPRFDTDFSSVRIHTGAQAAASARSVGAVAYTVGSDVVFANYAPHTNQGRSLLAHELAHVVQQQGRHAAAPTVRRHATSDCDTNKKGLVDSAVKKAVANIALVTPKLAANPLGADMENALWLYFRDSSAATASKVSTNLSSISNKISAVTYKCESDCEENMMGYTRLGTVITGLGTIHLCMNNLKDNVDDISYTIIHEVAHYALSAGDSAGYYENDCSESDTTVGAGSSSKLDLADSYNCFVKNSLTGDAASRADAKGDLTGANIDGMQQAPSGPIDLSAPKPKKPLFVVKLTRGPAAIVTGVTYRWVLRDPQDRSYLMTNLSGGSVFEFTPAMNSVIAIVNSKTRALLKERAIASGSVLCRAASPLFPDKVFKVPVTFT